MKTAKEFLLCVLDGGKQVATKLLEEEAQELGISVRTLRRAKKQLGVVAKHQGFGTEGVWCWCLKGGHES
jgi:hypothetical protein